MKKNKKIFIILFTFIILFVLSFFVMNISSTFSSSDYGYGKLNIYGNIYLNYFDKEATYTKDDYKHLIYYYDASGNAVDNFMDTFLFLPNTSYKYDGTNKFMDKNVTYSSWYKYLEDQNKSLTILNDAAKELGKTVNVILSLRYPPKSSDTSTAYDYYGDGYNTSVNNIITLMLKSEVEKVSVFSNIKVIGFYWFNESVRSTSAESAIKSFNNTVHATDSALKNYSNWADLYNFLNNTVKPQNYKTLWIPYIDNYYDSNYTDGYKNGYFYGFDFVSLQSGYYFRGNDSTWLNYRNNVPRLEFAMKQGLNLSMGIEVEGDSNSYLSETYYNRLYDFMVYGSNTALWNKSYNAYYFTGLGYYGNSNFPISRQIYDDTYKYSKGYKVTKSKNYSDYFIKDYDIISLGKSYTISDGVVNSCTLKYCLVNGKELTDGGYSGDAYGTDWVALNGKSSYDIVIDLGSKYTAITDIDVNFANNNSSGIYLPKKVSAYSSTDGSNYTYIGDLSWNYNNSKINFNMASLKLNSAATGRYVKIHIIPNATSNFILLSEITIGQRYSVVYYGNGGISSWGTSWSDTATYGSNYTIQDNFYTKDGYVFNGWTTNSNGEADNCNWTGWSGTWKYTNSNCGISNNTLKLYARWKAKTVDVTFVKNDGSTDTASQKFVYGGTGNKFGYNTDGSLVWGNSGQFGGWDRIGYTLLGWSENKDATSAEYGIYSDVANSWIDSNYPSIKLYAIWKPKTYTITYKGNGGSSTKYGTSWSNTATYGQSYKIEENWYVREGYTFAGWTINSDGTADTEPWIAGKTYTWAYVDRQYGIKGTNLTLYAIWKANTYTITLNNQSATSKGTEKAYYGYNTTKTLNGVLCYYYTNSSLTSCLSGGYNITKPTRTGYTFGGYYTGTNGSGTQYVDKNGKFVNDIYKTIGDKTLYAKWIINSYSFKLVKGANIAKIYYKVGNDTNYTESLESVNIKLNYNTAYSYYAVSNSGYTVSSCSPSSPCSGVIQTSSISKSISATINTYKINYVLNDGVLNIENPTSYTVATATFTLNNPVRTGYKFLGWSESGSDVINISVTIKKGTIGNKTFIANWKKEENTDIFGDKLNVDRTNKIIYKISVGSSLTFIKDSINTSQAVSFYDFNGNIIDNINREVKTGDSVVIKVNNVDNKYIISVLGDLNGDGKINVGDVAKLYRGFKNNNLVNYEKYSGDVTDDGYINVGDVAKLYRYVKGRINNL